MKGKRPIITNARNSLKLILSASFLAFGWAGCKRESYNKESMT